jgi:hypothetical protein
MYNLKELHDKKLRGSTGARSTTVPKTKRLPNDIAKANNADDNGSQPVTAN